MKNISVKILGKEYQISCPIGAETELIDAANYLDQKMTEIHRNGRIITFENILMTVAINLSHEILQLNRKQTVEAENLVDTVTSLQNKLNNALKTVSSNNLKFEYNNN